MKDLAPTDGAIFSLKIISIDTGSKLKTVESISSCPFHFSLSHSFWGLNNNNTSCYFCLPLIFRGHYNDSVE